MANENVGLNVGGLEVRQTVRVDLECWALRRPSVGLPFAAPMGSSEWTAFLVGGRSVLY